MVGDRWAALVRMGWRARRCATLARGCYASGDGRRRAGRQAGGAGHTCLLRVRGPVVLLGSVLASTSRPLWRAPASHRRLWEIRCARTARAGVDRPRTSNVSRGRLCGFGDRASLLCGQTETEAALTRYRSRIDGPLAPAVVQVVVGTGANLHRPRRFPKVASTPLNAEAPVRVAVIRPVRPTWRTGGTQARSSPSGPRRGEAATLPAPPRNAELLANPGRSSGLPQREHTSRSGSSTHSCSCKDHLRPYNPEPARTCT